MLRISYFFLALHIKYLLYEASPLTGENVKKADGNKLPFVVSISLNNSMKIMKQKYEHICGGSLITRQHVLTAAHCCINRKHYNEIVVKVGSFDLMSAKIHEVKWIVTYEEWVDEHTFPDEYRGENTHDIAVVKLVNRVSCSIRLPKLANTPDTELSHLDAITAGWGLKENNTRPRYLRVAQLTVLSSSECVFVAQEHDSAIKDFFSKIYLCTQANPPIISGCGDSGGPLVINEREIIGVNLGICFPHNVSELKDYQNKHLSVNYHRKFIDYVIKL